MDYDPQREAEEAMKLALSADGTERLRLIRLAMIWRELARAPAGRAPERRNSKAA
jgi:hypothetical protein